MRNGYTKGLVSYGGNRGIFRSQGDPLSSRVSGCLATPLAPASSCKSKGAARRIVKVLRSAIVRHRKESGSPWFQSWLPSPRREYGSETETSGARLQKRPRPRWSRVVTGPHREASHD